MDSNVFANSLNPYPSFRAIIDDRYPASAPSGSDRAVMKIKTLHDALVHELQDLHSAETQLTRALPKMAKASSHEDQAAGRLNSGREVQGHGRPH